MKLKCSTYCVAGLVSIMNEIQMEMSECKVLHGCALQIAPDRLSLNSALGTICFLEPYDWIYLYMSTQLHIIDNTDVCKYSTSLIERVMRHFFTKNDFFLANFLPIILKRTIGYSGQGFPPNSPL